MANVANADWSSDLLERGLASGFDPLGRAEEAGRLDAGNSRALADAALRRMNGALAKLAESQRTQERLRRELELVRAEMARLRTEHAARTRDLRDEMADLRERLAEREASLAAAHAAVPEPDDSHLSRPLVLRSAQGAFLGVTDGDGRPLCLAGLLRLVERGGRLGRLVATCWEPADDGWWLSVSVAGARPRAYALMTRPVLTPSGNQVAELTDIRVDGASAPRDYMVGMFRQLRDSFQE